LPFSQGIFQTTRQEICYQPTGAESIRFKGLRQGIG
jgi:hypothetical protein